MLVAEIVAHFLPRYVDLHCFMPASSTSLKKYNWETLNKFASPSLPGPHPVMASGPFPGRSW